jgi:hypothetical protein
VFQTDSPSASLIVANPVAINSGVSLSISGSGTVAFQSSITGQSSITVDAGGTLLLTSPSDVGALALLPNATASVAVSSAGRQNLLQVTSLSIAAGASLDLANNPMIVHGGNLASITASLAQGYNGGNWTGSGIISTTAAGDASHLSALAVIQTSTAGTFEGAAVNAGDVEIKYTYYGDANLDGKVDASDYSRIDNGYLQQLTGWFNGDFNYDGVVNGSDYTLIDNAFNSQGAAFANESTHITAEIAPASIAAVPEPTGLLPLVNCLVLLRRSLRRTATD